MNRPDPRNLLLSAYVCTKDAGSEPEIGYTTLLAATRAGYQVTVLTWAGQATQLGTDLQADGATAVTIIGLEGSRRLEPHIGHLGLGHIHYALWQLRAARLVRSMEGEFDVAHHVTFGTDWLPSAVQFLRSTPTVWGPVGGCSAPPWSTFPYLSGRGIAQELVREVVTRIFRVATLRIVRRSGSLVVAHNEDTAGWYRRRGCRTVTQPLVAMPPLPEVPARREPPGDRGQSGRAGRRTMVFVGRLTPWKGCLLAVHTLAALGDPWHLDVYGKGAANGRLLAIADRLGVWDRLHLKGHVPKSEIWSALELADVLLLPSLHDSAPQPVAQALRSGCPVVCLDTAGPPVLAAERGIAVPLGPRLPARLAAGVRAVQRFPPDNRWTADRLPGVLDEIYRSAVASSKTSQ